jgi:hypothetical protein
MKYIHPILSALVLSFFLLSCEKKETPYPMPAKPVLSDSTYEAEVTLGSDYKTQAYFSFTNGLVKTSPFEEWDINFTTDATDNELRVNGGKFNLIYLTEATNMSDVDASYTTEANKWKYDKPSGLPHTTGLGILNDSDVLGKVLIVQIGSSNSNRYKMIIKEITPTTITIATTKGLNEHQETEHVLEKNTDYNFAFFSFENGIVTPEPPKKDWDIVFTRYRHIYEAYNQDGSDFLYPVTGVLHNPYNTLSAEDTANLHDFTAFNKETFEQTMSLVPNRDVIGFDWKNVDINTSKYTVNNKLVFVIKDQKNTLWKFHFFGFTNNAGENGTPKFRYERL